MNDGPRRRVTVLVADSDERRQAEAILARVEGQEMHSYDGLITGWCDDAAVAALRTSRLVAHLAPLQDAEPGAAARPVARMRAEDADEGGAAAMPEAFESADLEAPDDDGQASYVATFSGPVRPDWLQLLESLGLSYDSRTGANAFRFLVTPGQADDLRSCEFVTSVVREREDAGDETEGDELEGGAAGLGGGFGPEALEESALEGMELPAFSSDATYDAVVRDVRYLTAVREFLEKQSGVTIEDAGGDTVRFTAPKDSGAIRAVARLPTVKLVAEFKPPTLLCNSGRSAIGLDRHDSAAVVLFPWTGKGVTVGVLDSGVDRAHPDVDPAVKQEFRMPGALPADTIGHGTHVAGIIAGRGVESGGKVVGAATGADLVVTWMVDTAGKLILPADYQALFGPPVQAGASILNLSWGTPIGAFYDQGAVQVDRLIYDEFPDTLFVIAAGNYGIALGGSHKFRTIGTPASAKNAITVGAWSAACDQQCCAGVNAAQTWGQKRGQKFPRPPAADELVSPPLPGAVTAISSRGPTDYESIKPDLVAPGQFIESTRATVIDESRFETQVGTTGPKYVCASGTSQAAPFVSGAAAILREYLREVRQTPKSSAALLKAMLIAAARRVPASSAARQAELQAKVGFPDFDQGFGLLDLSTLLPHDKAPANRKVVFIDIDNKGPDALASRQPENSPRRSSRTFEVTVTDGAVDRLRVVLCWTDWPGVHVQNSLQLDVRRPDGKAFLGNQDHIFQKNQDFDQLSIDTGTPLDKRNTVAVVEIASPPPGRYRIRVTANNTPFPIRDPRQGFALVVSGELASERF